MPATSRRRFIQTAAAAAVTGPFAVGYAAAAKPKLHIACNQFCWMNMYSRHGKNFNADLEAGLGEVKRSGMDGLEAMLGNADAAAQMIPLLQKHGLAMRSCYTGATMHDAEQAQASIDRIIATARVGKAKIGLQIVVVNPSPLRGQAKTDAQLAVQAEAMNRLGRQLTLLDVTLAYHFHSPAWQDDGREFHHLLTHTDPTAMKLCLDTHWVYRGAGNNADKVYEVVERYGDRVAELHLRQSKAGVWTECMSDGDIDYHRVASGLKAKGVKPLLVLEQAVEKGTPDTMDAVESHRRSRAYVEQVFACLWA